MFLPNFNSLAGLEVAEKFVVVGWGGEHVARVFSSNASCFELNWVLTINWCPPAGL